MNDTPSRPSLHTLLVRLFCLMGLLGISVAIVAITFNIPRLKPLVFILMAPLGFAALLLLLVFIPIVIVVTIIDRLKKHSSNTKDK